MRDAVDGKERVSFIWPMRSHPKTIFAFLGLSLMLTACLSHHDSGLKLGEKHARELKADTITLEELDEELNKAESLRDTKEDRDAFLSGYREGIEPAKAELAKLYVRTAAGGVEDASWVLEKGFENVLRGIVNAVETDSTSESESKLADKKRARMREVGRHLGRIVSGLSDAVQAAAEGFMEEFNKESEGRK